MYFCHNQFSKKFQKASRKNKSKKKLRKIPKALEKNKRKKIKKAIPNCSIDASVCELTGKIKKNNFDPSKGGMGIRLKKAKITFQKTIITSIAKKIEPKELDIKTLNPCQSAILKLFIMLNFTDKGIVIIFPKRAPKKAMIIFEPGPAKATQIGPLFWSLKLYGLYGTGLAPPKANRPPLKTRRAKGIKIVIIGSICRKGLALNLPAYLAVKSPR